MSAEEPDDYRRELELVPTTPQLVRAGVEPHTIRLRIHQNDRQYQDDKIAVTDEELSSLYDQLRKFFGDTP